MFCFNRIDEIPKNLHSVAKEVFKIAVCLKPRLIHTGIERFDRLKDNLNSQNVLPENELIENEGKSILKCMLGFKNYCLSY